MPNTVLTTVNAVVNMATSLCACIRIFFFTKNFQTVFGDKEFPRKFLTKYSYFHSNILFCGEEV